MEGVERAERVAEDMGDNFFFILFSSGRIFVCIL